MMARTIFGVGQLVARSDLKEVVVSSKLALNKAERIYRARTVQAQENREQVITKGKRGFRRRVARC